MPVDLQFSLFPETLVCVGTADYLHNSSIEFANFLKKKDEKKVIVKEYEGEGGY